VLSEHSSKKLIKCPGQQHSTMVVQLIYNHEVEGSNPANSTNGKQSTVNKSLDGSMYPG
jgi:hypothetical protein